MAAIAASPAPAASPKAALLASAAPEAVQSAPSLDGMFANLLSKSSDIRSPARSQPPAVAAKSQTAKQKTDPANAALMALIQGQAAVVPDAALKPAAGDESAQPAAAAAPTAGAAAVRLAAVQPGAQIAKTISANGAPTNALDARAASNPAQPGKNSPIIAAKNDKANSQLAPKAAEPPTPLLEASVSSDTSITTQKFPIANAAAAGDSKKDASSDFKALLSAHAHEAAPDAKIIQAKALPVQFDRDSGHGKAEAPITSASDRPGKDDPGADTQPRANDRAAASIQTRNDPPEQGTHGASSTPQSNAPAQPQAVGQSANGATGVAMASASAAASANTHAAPTQNSAPVLQVVPQGPAAAAVASPDLAALAVSIAAKSKDGEKQFDIRLDPPDLGRVDVRLSVDASGKAQAHLVADNQQTLDLLQRDRNDLERSLRDSGLDLSNNGLNFSLKGQEHQGGSTPAPMSGGALGLAVVASDEAAPSATANINGLSAKSRLDIRV